MIFEARNAVAMVQAVWLWARAFGFYFRYHIGIPTSSSLAAQIRPCPDHLADDEEPHVARSLHILLLGFVEQNRLVYRMRDEDCQTAQCKGHYDD